MVCSIASRKNTIQKIEEQLVKAKIAENDPPLKFTNKTHKKYIYIYNANYENRKSLQKE